MCIYCGAAYERTRPDESTVFCVPCTDGLNEHDKSTHTILWAGARLRSGQGATIQLGQQAADKWPPGFPVNPLRI